MKKSILKKTAALAASVTMIAAMAIPAAAVDTKISGVAPAVNGNTMNVDKDIYLFNVDGKRIYQPNITYTYTVDVFTPENKTVTGLTLTATDDPETTATVTVKKGVAGGVLLSSASTTNPAASADLVFGDDTALQASTKEGETRTAKVTESLTITTVDSAFTAAGIYRYTLTEDVDKDAAGVVDGNETGDTAVTTRYLDVYVKANEPAEGETLDDDAPAFVVYGLVLADEDESYEYDATKEASKKIGELDPDEYHTFNVTVTKRITGSMADKTHQFPFDLSLANETVTSGDEFTINEETASNVLGTYTFSDLKFKDEEGITIVGLPAGTTITVNETNDTKDVYNYVITQNGTEVKSNVLNVNASSDAGALSIARTTEGDEIVFTNSLDAISPTGLIFRFAPFAFMLTAGGMLTAVALRGKKRENEDSMI